MTWILAMAITFFVHPHYQSVTDIEFNSEDKIFEISITATASGLESSHDDHASAKKYCNQNTPVPLCRNDRLYCRRHRLVDPDF